MKDLLPIPAAVVAALIVSGCAQQAPRAENTASSENGLRMKARCAEAGAKARAEWIAKYDREHFSETPEYAYNADLNTSCTPTPTGTTRT